MEGGWSLARSCCEADPASNDRREHKLQAFEARGRAGEEDRAAPESRAEVGKGEDMVFMWFCCLLLLLLLVFLC